MGGPEGEPLEPEVDLDQSATVEAIEEPTAVEKVGALTKAAAILARTETPAKPKDARSLMRGLSMGPQNFVPGRNVDNKPPAKVSPTLAGKMKQVMDGGGGHGGYGGK
jgi:hypothetical protein